MADLEGGWVKLWRKIEHNAVFRDSRLCHTFLLCLIRASHNGNEFMFNGELIKIEPGQFIIGRHEASKVLGFKSKMWDRKLIDLEKLGILTRKVTNRFTLISIINWNTYQGCVNNDDQLSDHQMTNKRPANDQPMTTIKNVKNDKNDKNEKKKILYGEFQNVKLFEEEFQKLTNAFGESGTKDRIENLSQYMASKGKKYSSHYATILAWERKKDGTHQPGNPRGAKEKCTKYNGIGTSVET